MQWFTNDRFPSPRNWDNRCTEHQMLGWNFSSLTSGDQISHYDGYTFSNFANRHFRRRAQNRPSVGIPHRVRQRHGH
jgi:hypothetical protein